MESLKAFYDGLNKGEKRLVMMIGVVIGLVIITSIVNLFQ